MVCDVYSLFISCLTPVWQYGLFDCLFSPNASEAKRHVLSVCPFISFAWSLRGYMAFILCVSPDAYVAKWHVLFVCLFTLYVLFYCLFCLMPPWLYGLCCLFCLTPLWLNGMWCLCVVLSLPDACVAIWLVLFIVFAWRLLGYMTCCILIFA